MRSGEYIGIYGVRVERDLTERRIARIQQALMRSSAPTHLIVRRGIDDAFLRTYIDAQGTTILERAFTSTTILDDVGFGYLKATIYVPKGSPGAYVEPLIRRAGKKEWEFLLPSGSSFKIIRTYHNKDVGKCVEMEYLGVV